MIAALNEAQDEMMRALAAFLQHGGAQPVGPPFVRYQAFANGVTDLEVGVPVSKPVAGAGRIVGGELHGGPVVTVWHLGGHDTLGDGYVRLGAGVTAFGREPRGAAWEVYCWIDPSHYKTAQPTGLTPQNGAPSWFSQSTNPDRPSVWDMCESMQV
jgi:hypothetical protein